MAIDLSYPVLQERGAAAPPRTLIDVFSATCRRWGDRVALDTPSEVLTYDELDAAASRLAERLHVAGLGAGDRVAVRVPSGGTDLYVAILGVLSAGAAYVPIDFDDPPARVADVLARSGARAVVGAELSLELLDTPVDASAAGSVAGSAARPVDPCPEDDAWVIFTSGSTGAPKGVAVTHRSAAAFVDAEAQLWTVHPEDRVLAGLSVGFDASCEEIWLAWANGAALVPAPRDLVRAGAELGSWLVEREITVVSTVPTLVSLWDESCLYNVRLLIVGGEACPEALGWRLAAGREVWNTYGPTEATVVSTAAPIVPGQPITIGWPLAGWQTAVVEGDRPVKPGEAGELVIGGVGLGRYLDPALDAARYAPLPALGWDRAYRTGDIVRATPDGLMFVGRNDDQVKVGGRRIELGEIDAALLSAPGVRAAAAAVRETASGNKLLVGYVVGDSDVNLTDVRVTVARRLPSGIVPLVVSVEQLPLRPSGKVDRKALPWPIGGDDDALAVGIGADGRLLSELEVWVAQRWIDQLGPHRLTHDSDFFALGGTSLAAAKLITSLRVRFPAVAVADLYRNPTLRRLCSRLEGLAAESEPVSLPEPGRRVQLAGMQSLGLLVLFTLAAIPWVLGTFAYGNLVSLGTPRVGWGWLIAAYAGLASPPARALTQIVLTRILLRNVAPGRYSRCSSVAARLWFIQRLAEVTHADRFGGTPWAARYARLLGASVADNVRLATLPPPGARVRIGAGATIEGEVDLQGWWIDGAELVFGEITIGAEARVGQRSVLAPGAVVGDRAEVEPGSVVQGTIPAGQRWGGVPAVYLGAGGTRWPQSPPGAAAGATRLWRWAFGPGMLLGPLLFLLAAIPDILVFDLGGLRVPGAGAGLLGSVEDCLISVVIWVPTFAILVALALRAMWRPVRPGWHPDYGAVGWSLWASGNLLSDVETVLFPLYASVFTRRWLQLMGVKVGRRSEISTSSGLNPLVRFGEFCQVTDDVFFGGVRARGGWLLVEPIELADRSFVGPAAIIPGGTLLPTDSLIGALTLAPQDAGAGSSWFGVPALELPPRPRSGDAERTVNPGRIRVVSRTLMDALRVVVPNTLALVIDLGEIQGLATACRTLGVLPALLLAPLVLFAGGVVAALVTIGMKWALIGRYRRGEHPLWSFFVWRDEMINTAQEQLAVDKLLGMALGTPLMAMYLRAMGGRVGRGTWIETTAITEYEMLDLGDGVAANRGSCLMTHLFHDRMLRIGPTQLGAGVTLGPKGAVLPDTVVGDGTWVGAHSVVMRGEELPAATRWLGVPVAAA